MVDSGLRVFGPHLAQGGGGGLSQEGTIGVAGVGPGFLARALPTSPSLWLGPLSLSLIAPHPLALPSLKLHFQLFCTNVITEQ